MKTYLAAAAFAAALAQPAAAVMFPSLTTIYVGSGVMTMATTIMLVKRLPSIVPM